MTFATLVGQRINRYEVKEHVGDGGMANVYLAHDTSLNRQVCLKVMLPRLSLYKDLIKRFHREAQAVARLEHPHIVKIYDTGLTPTTNQPFLIMEYVPGGTLETEILARQQRGEPYTVIEILEIAQIIAGALMAVHQANMVHRDVKPANILLREDGTPVLADLGIAAVAAATRLTHTGHMPGTPHYMSPEQVQGQKLDGRSDIYALGIILYELLAGLRPFVGKDRLAVMHQQIYQSPTPLARHRRGLAPATYRLVETCLAKNPEQRYQNTNQLAAALQQALAAERSGSPTWGAHIVARFSRHPWQWLGGLLVFVLLLAFLLTGRLAGQSAAATPTAVPIVAATRVPTAMPTRPVLPTATAAIIVPPPPSRTPTPTPTTTSLPTTTPTNTTVPNNTPLSTATAFFTPLPTPTSVATDTASSTALAATTCLPDPGPRWGPTLYNEFAARLGCPYTPVTSGTALYQLYPNGLMVWRQDTEQIYVLYYAGSFNLYPADLVNGLTYYENDLRRGIIGYLWHSHNLIQQQLGTPETPEMGASEFAFQEFATGTIFYFKENRQNTYVLLNDQNHWLAIQEK